jgi:bla regulator protein BlaR1
MQQLFQSAFLQSLGFAIANSLWQTALLWLVYIAVSHLLPLSSAAKYRLAVIAQLVSFVWFVVTIQFYYSEYRALLNAAPMAPAGSMQAVIAGNEGTASQLLRYMVKVEQMLPYVSMAYLLLMVFLCIRWFSGYRQTQLVRNQGLQKIPVDWKLFVQRISAQLGIKKEVRLYLSENITTPLTIGFLKPIILVPLASINHLTTEQLEAVLLHELAHIKRYDYLVNIILSAVEIGLFFNPFTQMLRKQIHKERENSCDDWVLQFQYKASDYAEALLRIAYMQATPALAMAATGKKNDLLVRVKRMIGQKENQFNYRRQLLALALVTAILSSIAWLNPVYSTHHDANIAATGKQAVGSYKHTIAIEPMAMKVSNPLFNPVFFLSDPLKEEVQRGLAAAQKEMADLVTPVNGHPALIETISPMVANAMEIAAHEMAEKESGLDRQLSSLTSARKAIEGLLADSLFANGKIQSEWNKAFKTVLREVPANIEKAKKEIANNQQLKRQMNWDAAKFSWDNEKVQKDISNAMEELKNLSFDKMRFEFPDTRQKTADDKNASSKKSMMRPKKEVPAPGAPDGPGQFPLMEKQAMPAMPVINVNNKSFVLDISPVLLNELMSLAQLALRTDIDKASPEFQKIIQIKTAMIEKALAGENRMIRTVNIEKNSEAVDSVMMRLQ